MGNMYIQRYFGNGAGGDENQNRRSKLLSNKTRYDAVSTYDSNDDENGKFSG